MKKLNISNLTKSVFWATFSISTVLTILLIITNFSVTGFIVMQISTIYLFVGGILNLLTAGVEFYKAISNKENYRIHRNSALLILLNFPIGLTYFYLVIFIEDKC